MANIAASVKYFFPLLTDSSLSLLRKTGLQNALLSGLFQLILIPGSIMVNGSTAPVMGFGRNSANPHAFRVSVAGPAGLSPASSYFH